MNPLVTSIQNLSNPVKLGVAVAGGGGLVGTFALLGWNGTAVAVVVAGLVVLGLVLLGYRQVLKLLAKRKAAPMAQALASHSASAPQGISDPARRARLDDMRKNFETGVEKFRAAGKNIYALPWYLLVGEPGSGKTEAVRHCNVGFPPGLQDQLQGVGGTINMNWWFTNHAVILDTAGRLMFEEVEPGSTSEWQEFMKLLRKTRPNCPVNGMVLVVPAESLIKDTADSIERKGGKIAQQLDQIQRALGVRFPVFVVITKCDLINGFREYFDDMRDPQLQHQILGWSNPAPLDEPFNPELIEKHLEQVQKRLVRRRLGLMLDPVHSEDPTARRTDQVDALFAFPEAMVKIAPRLRRYLEMIFVAGVWSAKPLFLRGIYFTSSMREGSALDADLAEALGMPMESLPEGRVWERDRAYFLRDLFLNKVFRERGLVTRAVNTKAQQRQRRTVLLSAAGVGAIALAAFTFFGSSGLKRDIVAPKDFWKRAQAVYERGKVGDFIDERGSYLLPIVSRQSANSEVFTYDGSIKATFEDFKEVPEEMRRVGRFPEQLRDAAQASVPVPWVFSPIAVVTGDAGLNLAASERREAARVLIESSVVRPLVEAAAVRMQIEGAKKLPWTPEATAALAQIMRVEVARATGEAGAAGGGLKIEPLLAYAVMSRDTPEGYSAKDAQSLQSVVDWLYTEGGAKLPPRGPELLDRVRTGVGTFATAWQPDSPSAGGLAEVTALRRSLAAFRDAEAELLRISDRFGVGRDYAGAFDAWGPRFTALSEAARRVDAEIAALGGRTLTTAYREELEKFRLSADAAHKQLLDELDAVKPVEGERESERTERLAPLRALRGALEENLRQVRSDSEGAAELQDELARLDAQFVGRAAGGDPAYKARFAAYELVNAQFGEGGAVALGLGEFGPRFEEVAGAIRTARTQASAKLVRPQAAEAGSLAPKLEEAQRLCDFVLDAAGRRWQRALLQRLVMVGPDSADGFAEAVMAYAQARNLAVPRPVIPLTRAAQDQRGEFEVRFNPTAAAALLLDIVRAREAAVGKDEDAGPLDTSELRERFQSLGLAADEYRRRFVGYWREGHLQEIKIVETDWAKIVQELKQAPRGYVFNGQLKAVAAAMTEAAKQAEKVLSAEDLTAIRSRAAATASSVDQESFSLACDRVLGSWSGVAQLGLAIDARTRVLESARAGTFDENYVVVGSGPSAGGGDFAAVFWQELCLQSVVALSIAVEQEAKRACERLQAEAAFPLTLPGDGRTMSPEAVAAARGSVKTILMRGSAAATTPLSRSPEFKAALERLGGPGLLTELDRAWLDRVDGVLRALPDADERSLTCMISVVSGRPLPTAERPLEELIQSLGIVQGSTACAGTIRPGRGSAPPPVPVSFAGEAVRMCFFTYADEKTEAARVEFRGPWAALQMLHDLKAVPVKDSDNKVWEAELVVPFAGQGGNVKLGIWVRLEFPRPVPDLGKWAESKWAQ